MRQMRLRGLIPLIVLLATMFLASSVEAAGNNWVHGVLRVDSAAIRDARRYTMLVAAYEVPNTGSMDSFTTGWLAVWPEGNANAPQGFTQVGLITFPTGLRWFAYSELGINCLDGTPHWGNLGCRGDINEYVQLTQWTRVELLKNIGENFWRVIVIDQAGFPHTVAQIPSASNQIFRADADFEEGYVEPIDPQIGGKYFLYHPQYFSGGAWRDWQLSAAAPSQHNHIRLVRAVNGVFVDPIQITFCPTVYGTDTNLNNDP
jgi:hypothetical protein